MHMFVSFYLGLSVAQVITTGLAECPCIDGWSDQDEAALQRMADSDSSCIEIENDSNGTYSGCVPFTSGLRYGSSRCNAWDQQLPYCTESSCSENLKWCSDQWCYVDFRNCAKNVLSYKSSFWPSLSLQYSYQTCGSLDSWTGSLEDFSADLNVL